MVFDGVRIHANGPVDDELGAAHRAVVHWCIANGHELDGPRWEICGDWRQDSAELETKIYYLLRESLP